MADDAPGVAAATSQIGELVRRIEDYQARRAAQRAPGTGPAAPLPRRADFHFSTGGDGVIAATDFPARAAVIGLSLGDPAATGQIGVDAAAAGAFRQRRPIVNARLTLATTDMSADWRISATPRFDAASGQFLGYDGMARQPSVAEAAYPVATAAEGNPAPGGAASGGGDAIRQLVHELRSPLNAVSGFAQIIAAQIFGPVARHYRDMADDIVSDAARLQDLIDDIDVSMRPAAHSVPPAAGVDDANLVVALVEGDLRALHQDRGIGLTISRVGNDFMVGVERAHVQRMIGRLLTALTDVTGDGEPLVGQLLGRDEAAAGLVRLRLNRPAAIRHAAAAELLDPGFTPAGEAPGAAHLGLGFSLRLVANLARASGGDLAIGANALTLTIGSGIDRDSGNGAALAGAETAGGGDSDRN